MIPRLSKVSSFIDVMLAECQRDYPDLMKLLEYSIIDFISGKRFSRGYSDWDLMSLMFANIVQEVSFLTDDRSYLDFSNPSRGNIWAKTEGRCLYCFDPFNFHDYWEKDHILPRSRISKKDKDSLLNLFVSCPRCNRRKGNKTSIEYVGPELGLVIPLLYNISFCFSSGSSKKELFDITQELHRKLSTKKWSQDCKIELVIDD